MSRVDVIIPCYNYGRFLRQCADSVLTQQGVEVRVLVLDDSSPDDTPDVGAALASRDSRVEYRRHQVNRGHIAAYNEGLEWARGDYVLLLSADDILVPGALRRAARVMDTHGGVGFVYGKAVTFEGEPGASQTAAEQIDSPCDAMAGEEFVAQCCDLAGNNVATPAAVVRTTLQQEVGGYRASLPHTADLEMWLRLAARAAVGRLHAHQAHKRKHRASMCNTYFQTVLPDLRQLHEAFVSFFDVEGHRLRDCAGLRTRATEGLAMKTFWAASRSFDAGDAEMCGRLLDYSVELWPGVTGTRAWARLRWKRRLGTRAWSVLRPVVERWRGSAAASHCTGAV
jgi:glycosyltransferase involved in cell wall biosynthesis